MLIRQADTTAVLPKRLDALTSLRFFAALAVFAHHFTGLGGKTGFGRSPWIFPYSQMGAHGVTFFFVLSGFLMIWVFKPQEKAVSFWWRRVGRIFPVHLVTLPLAIYAFYIAAHADIHWGSLLSAVFLVQGWFPGITPTLPGNPVTWTLSVELLFYALFPLIAPIVVRIRTRWLACASLAGLAAMWAINWYSVENFTPATASWVMRHPVLYLPVFLLGMTLALAIQRGRRVPLHPIVPIGALALYTYGYYQVTLRVPKGVLREQLDYTLRPTIALLAALIILSFVQREIVGRRGILNKTLLINLGLWSYSFYLIHHAVSRLSTYEWGRMPDNNAVLFTLLGMALVINILSWALFTYVEEPAERWWRTHMPKSWRTPRDAAGDSALPPRPREREAEPAQV
ncbi:acyltransferase [Actinoplanes ianthinogenes]|uniref:Acyltransferase n=1 Tax=Actinoplanes ianthinogenes TaxID=122358 RepID=A0ABM7LWT8_9ACTN|nr:acyltransferase [Actinoplanes ianthinogenes]BCJ43641.1 acyltransferase [Actinoplanes ianthinogenes]GGR18666.1 acyltransferase [Actinoplanes ianthinogenes]